MEALRMTNVLTFLLLGLGGGAIYALLAQGLVLVYKGSSVVNFAQAAIGMVGAYAFYELEPKAPTAIVVIVGVIVSAAISLTVQWLIMRPMLRRSSSPLARVIATLGVLAVIGQALLIKYGPDGQFYNSFLPDSPWKITSRITVPISSIWLLAISAVLSTVLWAIYRFTRFGLATSAAAENPVASAALGWSPTSLMSISWALGGALAGLAAILVGPVTSLSPDGGSSLIVPALAAALVGNFSSFSLTFAGGLLIGVLESESSFYAATWTSAVPFIVIIAILVVRGRALPLRGYLNDRLPRVGSARPRPLLILLGVVATFVSLRLFGQTWENAVTTSAIAAVLCLSLVVITGYAGQISLAQYAMAGVGGLVAGRLADAERWPFLAAMVAAIVAATLSGIIVGLPAVRVRGVNLAVVTLGLGLVIQSVVLGNANWTGGPIVGTVIPTPHLFGWDIDSFDHPGRYAEVCTALFVLCALLVANLRRGRSGRRLLAVRDNERAAASVGINVFTAKLYAFALASGLAAVGGGLLVFRSPNVEFSQFSVDNSIALVTLVVIGGVGFVGGSVIGGQIVTSGIVAAIIAIWFDPSEYFLLITGCLLLVQLVLLPDGVAIDVARFWKKGMRWFPAVGVPAPFRPPTGDATPVRVTPKPFELEGITVEFGGVRALEDVSLTVVPGEVVGLIGPNGAGKTTLIDVASGFVRPKTGTVTLAGEDISKLPAHRRARVGLVRSWQSLELFEQIDVRENLIVADDKRDAASYLTDLVRPGHPSIGPELAEVIDNFELNDLLDCAPADLPYAQRHLVGIARAVASSASVLLLDEPTAGLDSHSTEQLGRMIRRLAEDRGLGILIVEHDVPLVMDICDRIVVLERGTVIATGSPEQLRADPRVVEAYMGSSTDEPEATKRDPREPSRERVMVGATPGRGSAGDENSRPNGAAAAAGPSALPLIRATGASAGYGKVPVVQGLDIEVHPGEVVALFGANGAGKTTVMRMLAGVIPLTEGSVELGGQPTRDPLHQRCRNGIAYVTEERSVFRGLTVAQNLRIGRGTTNSALELVPELRQLLRRRAGVLSGGEAQMLTLARSLTANPSVLLADELSLGLAPIIVKRLFEAVRAAADSGTGVLLVEQQPRLVLPFCNRAYVLRRGRIVMSIAGDEMASRLHEIEAHYLGDAEPVADSTRTPPSPSRAVAGKFMDEI
jgi:ABC-type branched-subunit amino acid transport system ATPase component/branched-subunit amino acid ABC-type transport system permease component